MQSLDSLALNIILCLWFWIKISKGCRCIVYVFNYVLNAFMNLCVCNLWMCACLKDTFPLSGKVIITEPITSDPNEREIWIQNKATSKSAHFNPNSSLFLVITYICLQCSVYSVTTENYLFKSHLCWLFEGKRILCAGGRWHCYG